MAPLCGAQKARKRHKPASDHTAFTTVQTRTVYTLMSFAQCNATSMHLAGPLRRQLTHIDHRNKTAHASAHRPPACCRSPCPGCCPPAAPALRGPGRVPVSTGCATTCIPALARTGWQREASRRRSACPGVQDPLPLPARMHVQGQQTRLRRSRTPGRSPHSACARRQPRGPAPQYPGVPTSIVFAWLLDSLMLRPKSAAPQHRAPVGLSPQHVRWLAQAVCGTDCTAAGPHAWTPKAKRRWDWPSRAVHSCTRDVQRS